MTMSMRVMSAGAAYRYLLKSVAVGDGSRDMTAPLIRYYTTKGTPPGRWFGSGVPALGIPGTRVVEGQAVTEEQLRRLLGEGRDPLTGAPLGRAHRDFTTDANGARRRAVAGYDHTFSLPKSLSALWAVADAGTQALIATAHHETIRDMLAIIERDVAATRTGSKGPDGAVAQVPVRGVVATAFDHYDSRASDPHLHTHVVIANRVQGPDGRWRALDGRPIHAAVVALSETYTGMLMDRVHRELGVVWERRDRGERRAPAREIKGVPEKLIAEFSSRSHDIDAEHARCGGPTVNGGAAAPLVAATGRSSALRCPPGRRTRGPPRGRSRCAPGRSPGAARARGHRHRRAGPARRRSRPARFSPRSRCTRACRRAAAAEATREPRSPSSSHRALRTGRA